MLTQSQSSWQVLVKVPCMVCAASESSRYIHQSVVALTEAEFLELLSLVDVHNAIKLLLSLKLI